MEIYTPKTFIKIATEHAGRTPCGVVQATENLWGAAASAVKLFSLRCGVDLKSHSAREFFMEFAGVSAYAKKILFSVSVSLVINTNIKKLSFFSLANTKTSNKHGKWLTSLLFLFILISLYLILFGCHSHFYEHDCINPAKIGKMIEQVTKFVETLASWDPKDFESDLIAALSDPKLKLTVLLQKVPYMKKFAGETWEVYRQVGSKPAKIGSKS
jgi:hypothetical protein